MSPKHQNNFAGINTTSNDTDSGAVLLGDVTSRLGRLEDQVNQILPVLGKVSQAVENLDICLQDIKIDVKSVNVAFSDFRLDTASHKDKIKALEDYQNTLEKNKRQRRYDILKMIGTGVVSLVVGVILAFWKFK
jgi:hypothetical protein